MMTVQMGSASAPSSRELAQSLFQKNVDLGNGLRRSAQSKLPTDPTAWTQMRDNYEAIILEDHEFSEQREVEYLLWLLHHKRIEEYRGLINASAAGTGSVASQGGKVPRTDRLKKIRASFRGFLSEATGFYHDLILKIRAKYGLPLGYFSEGPENQATLSKDEKKSTEMKKGLLSCHRCLIYLGDLARYKGMLGEGDSASRDYTAASSYYLQAASLWPSSGNPHHQLAILALYAGDDLMTIYRYFRSLAVDHPFSTARENLIMAFEKNRQRYSQLPSNAKASSGRTGPNRMIGRGRGRGDARVLAKDGKTEVTSIKVRELTVPDVFKAFSTRFIRLNGILFTRTSLETFGDVFSSVISDLYELLSSGPEELNFGSDVSEDGLVIVRLVTILIFTVHNVSRESEGQSYAEILQRSVMLQNAFTAAFEFVGHILKRCIQLHDISSSYLLPAILVFIEWLACHPDIAAGNDDGEIQTTARSFFWNQCISFMNKLLVSGVVSIGGDEDETCFSDMSRYEEEETGNRAALWEDFELRGFSPLAPAHLILDFSRKHSFGSEESNKGKKARMQRILAAGRALMNMVQVDQQGIYFDVKLKKFVIGTEPQTFEDDMQNIILDLPKSNGIKQGIPVEDTVDLGVFPSKAQSYIEGEEDDDEVIVFKPTVLEKYPDAPIPAAYETATVLEKYSDAPIPAAHETVQPVMYFSDSDWENYAGTLSSPPNKQPQNILNVGSYKHTAAVNTINQPPLQHVNPMTSKWLLDQDSFLSDGMKNLSFVENGFGGKSGFLEDIGSLQPTTFSLPFSAPANTSVGNMPSNQIKAAESMIPSKLDFIVPAGANFDVQVVSSSSAFPTISKKNPVSRPVRHLGPPPGFSSVPSRQQDDLISSSVLKDQNSLVDDYSWLDGYQSKGMVMEDSLKHTAQMFPHVTTGCSNSLSNTINFPFPGKQIPTMQVQVENNDWQNYQLIEHLNRYAKQQQQDGNQLPAPLLEQYQAQPLFPSRYFV